MIKLLLDGVAFQLNAAAAERRWAAVINVLQHDARFDLLLLDRGNLPSFANATPLPFPSHTGAYLPADSQQIQNVCNHFGVDAFVSTDHTTPLATPSVLTVDDLMPELRSRGEQLGAMTNRVAAMSFAQRYVCSAAHVRRDLLSLYPEIPLSHASVALLGIDHATYRVHSHDAIDAFRARQQLAAPYLLYRAPPRTPDDDKLLRDVLHPFAASSHADICIVGDQPAGQALSQQAHAGAVRYLNPDDDDALALAINGAVATLQWPQDHGCLSSLAETLACGCPLITHGVPEVVEACGDAAWMIGGRAYSDHDPVLQLQDLHHTLDAVANDAARREAMCLRGLAQAARFQWATYADGLALSLVQLVDESRRGVYSGFFAEWARLRAIQASVDFPA